MHIGSFTRPPTDESLFRILFQPLTRFIHPLFNVALPADFTDPKKVRPRIIAPSTQRVVSESRQTQRDESEFSRDASTRQVCFVVK